MRSQLHIIHVPSTGLAACRVVPSPTHYAWCEIRGEVRGKEGGGGGERKGQGRGGEGAIVTLDVTEGDNQKTIMMHTS